MGEYQPGLAPLQADIATLQAEVVALEAINDVDLEWVGAGDIFLSSGAAALTLFSGGTSAFAGWLMDAATDEAVEGSKIIPTFWNTFAVDLYWTNQAAGAGDVAWLVNRYRGSAGANLSTLINAGSTVLATAPAQQVLRVDQLATGLVVADIDLSLFQLFRQGTHGSDNLPNDATVIGLLLRRLT